MGDNIFREIAEAFRDDFRAGVRAVAQGPVIFVDPDDYAKDDNGRKPGDPRYDDSNVSRSTERLRRDLEKQLPGVTADATDADLRGMRGLLLARGPFAVKFEHEGREVSIVNGFSDGNDPEKRGGPARFVSWFGGLPAGFAENFKADGDDLARFIGVHEGAHTNEPILDENAPDHEILAREARADHAGLQDLRRRGEHGLAQKIHDWRAIRAHLDPLHATSVLVDGDRAVVPAQAHVDAARNFHDNMVKAVADELKILPEEARAMLDGGDRRGFIDTVDRLLEEGRFDASPLEKAYTADYAGAYRRQILSREPQPRAANRPGLSEEFGRSAADGQVAARQETEADPAAVARANEGMGNPEVAGNAALAAAAAAQAGIEPATVTQIAAADREVPAPVADTGAKPVLATPAV